MTEPQTATCPECYRAISPDDTIVFGYGRLGHLDCRRPRVLSPEERTVLSIYCRDHIVAQCGSCGAPFRLPEVEALDSFGIRSHACRWCHADLTDNIRAHLYGCATLPAEVRRSAVAARDAAQRLVQRSLELQGPADAVMREAQAALYEFRLTMRQWPQRRVG